MLFTFFFGHFKVFFIVWVNEIKWGGGVWAMAGVQGKVAFGLSPFCIEVFQKKVIVILRRL